MKNGLLKLDWASAFDAVLMAVLFAVISALVTLVSTSGFDIFHTNWLLVGENMLNVGFITAVVSLGQSLFSTNDGRVLGMGTPTTPANN